LQHNNGNLHGSQGLLQNLLDLGEAFLASEIGEEDLEDLQTKLSAARSRDYGTIRELQKKIEELSGMSAMVSRLKVKYFLTSLAFSFTSDASLTTLCFLTMKLLYFRTIYEKKRRRLKRKRKI
jgi:hypothetical protein